MAAEMESLDPIEAFRRLGVSLVDLKESRQSKARDQVAMVLAADILSLRDAAKESSLTLERLYALNLLPPGIGNRIRALKRHGLKLDELYKKPLASFDDHDFYKFGRLPTYGKHAVKLLRSLYDIYCESDYFRKIPFLRSPPPAELDAKEQSALIGRITSAVRNDRNARRMLMHLFPP